MKISDSVLARVKPAAKPYKVPVDKGLYLLVNPLPSGSKLWRFRYKWHGKDQLLSLGSYPTVDLDMAKSAWIDAKRKLKSGTNPAEAKQTEASEAKNLFRAVCEEWFTVFYPDGGDKAQDARQRLEHYVYPKIGSRVFNKVEANDMHECLDVMVKKGNTWAAHACRRDLKRIGQWAVAKKYALANQADYIMSLMKPHTGGNLPGFTDPRDVGWLLRGIDSYAGRDPEVSYYLKILPYVFCRPGELRHARWSMIDWKAKELHLPMGLMKMRRDHVVPLSKQVIALLKEVQQFSGSNEYVFPGFRPKRPISEMTGNRALQLIGVDTKTEHCMHGWRTTASTLLSQFDFTEEVREAQLAHLKPGVAGIYNKYEFIEKRVPMMQRWADYLDELRSTLPEDSQDRPASTARLKSSMSASSQRAERSLCLNGRGKAPASMSR